MLFDVIGLADTGSSQAVTQAIHGLDPKGQVTIDLDRGRLLVEGDLSQADVVAALNTAGYPASVAPEHPQGTTCCGSCS